MATCQYSYISESPQINFRCNEEASAGSTLCIFHDANYVKDHYPEYETEAIKRLEQKIQASLSKNEPLECIGFFIPSLQFTNYFQSFPLPVYFNKSTFYDADFSGAGFATPEVLAELARRDLNKKLKDKYVIKDVDKEQWK